MTSDDGAMMGAIWIHIGVARHHQTEEQPLQQHSYIVYKGFRNHIVEFNELSTTSVSGQ